MEKDMTLEQAIAHKAANAIDNHTPQCGDGGWTKHDLDFLYRQGYNQCLQDIMSVSDAEMAEVQNLKRNIADLERKNEALAADAKAEHLQSIKTSNKLAAYEDKTYISEDFLVRNGFEKRIITNGKPTLPPPSYLYCDDVEEISAQCIDAEMGVWRVYVGFLESGNGDTLDICTVGQLCMFLAICGLDDIIKQFKA